MKKLFMAAACAASLFAASSGASAQTELTGDVRLACEAVMCLASGQRPDECSPSLRRYFSISHRRLRDTLRGRLNFLKMCPSSNETPEMQALVQAVANGAGRCDAQSLNTDLMSYWGEETNIGGTYVSNQLPDYCTEYSTNPYTDLASDQPRYVGTPRQGGYWVEAANYNREVELFNARLLQQQQEWELRQQQLHSGS